MNCRPGDLARIVGLHPKLGLNDLIVKLADKPAFDFKGVACWWLEEQRTITLTCNGRASGVPFSAGDQAYFTEVPDRNLRPIRPQPDDAVDQMVRLVGAAPKTLTEVREVSHG